MKLAVIILLALIFTVAIHCLFTVRHILATEKIFGCENFYFMMSYFPSLDNLYYA